MRDSNSPRRYEAHLTFDKKYATLLKAGVEGWTYSAIDDDPIMGQKPYCYLTAYSASARVLKSAALRITKRLKEDEGVFCLRLKIERIVFDSKTKWNALDAEV